MTTTTATAPLSISERAEAYEKDDTRKYWAKAGYYSDAQLWAGGIMIKGYVYHGFRGPRYTTMALPIYREPIKPFNISDGSMTLTWRRIPKIER